MSGSRQRREARQAAEDAVADLEVRIPAMRRIAVDARNAINITGGEDLLSKIGWIPDPEDSDGRWISARLSEHLSVSAMLPGWSTHIVLTFCVEWVRSMDGPKRIEHLSWLWHIPTMASTHELRLLRDRTIQESVPLWIIRDFFGGAEDVLTAIRAGEYTKDEKGQIWTPVILHFYRDHEAAGQRLVADTALVPRALPRGTR